jgi:hypothetical protein
VVLTGPPPSQTVMVIQKPTHAIMVVIGFTSCSPQSGVAR